MGVRGGPFARHFKQPTLNSQNDGRKRPVSRIERILHDLSGDRRQQQFSGSGVFGAALRFNFGRTASRRRRRRLGSGAGAFGQAPRR